MQRLGQIYEGKAKKVYATDNPDYVIVSYKDDATAFNGLKKGTIEGKGVINNKMSNMMMGMLEKKGIPTHFVEQLSDRDTLVKKVEIVPLEVIIRNVAAGSFSKRYGVERNRACRRNLSRHLPFLGCQDGRKARQGPFPSRPRRRRRRISGNDVAHNFRKSVKLLRRLYEQIFRS